MTPDSEDPAFAGAQAASGRDSRGDARLGVLELARSIIDDCAPYADACFALLDDDARTLDGFDAAYAAAAAHPGEDFRAVYERASTWCADCGAALWLDGTCSAAPCEAREVAKRAHPSNRRDEHAHPGLGLHSLPREPRHLLRGRGRCLPIRGSDVDLDHRPLWSGGGLLTGHTEQGSLGAVRLGPALLRQWVRGVVDQIRVRAWRVTP